MKERMKLSESSRMMLCCPVCHGELETTDNSIRCLDEQCSAAFPLIDEVPVMINEATSIFDASTFVKREATFFKPVGRLRKLVSKSIPDISSNVTAKGNFQTLCDLLGEREGTSTVLVLGGGVVGAGMKCLLDDPNIEVIETDVSIESRTQLICDAHDLPFKDSSIDAIVVQAVLEHVVDPIHCVDEIYRVLKPQGLVYSDTPFIQQVHGREFDFTRFTRLGHRRLFRQFKEVTSGITCGPGMALAWTLRYFFMSFFTSKRLRAIASGISRLAFFWLKYLDYYLVRKPGAYDAASAFYFLGRKSNNVLSDRELVASYRGGF